MIYADDVRPGDFKSCFVSDPVRCGASAIKCCYTAAGRVIQVRNLDEESTYYAYKLIATKKTSTLQKELIEAGIEGYEFVGFTVSKSRFGGAELIAILRQALPQ